jgi:hypothetical protein
LGRFAITHEDGNEGGAVFDEDARQCAEQSLALGVDLDCAARKAELARQVDGDAIGLTRDVRGRADLLTQRRPCNTSSV